MRMRFPPLRRTLCLALCMALCVCCALAEEDDLLLSDVVDLEDLSLEDLQTDDSVYTARDDFIDRIINGQPIEVWGAGKNVRDYIYIDDLVDAMEKAADYSGTFRCFNIGSSTGTSIKKVIRLIEQYSGRKANGSYRPGRICDAESSYLNNDLAVRELGWKPTVTLSEGIQRLIARYGA